MQIKKILVIVDAQNEFITGDLGNTDCENAVPNIVNLVEKEHYDHIILTQDTHDRNYLNTQEGRRLPVIHGQKYTIGHRLNPDILNTVISVCKTSDTETCTIQKSTFGSKKLGKLLKTLYLNMKEQDVEIEIHFCGFCTGICVISNVIIAKTYCPEARICVIADACACVTPETHQTALSAMKTLQVDIV